MGPIPRVFNHLINNTIDTMTKHLVSSLRKGGILHHTKFHQSIVKFGQGYCPKPVSNEEAMEAGAELLVCYTLAGSSITCMVYQAKKYLDGIKYVRLETEQLKQTHQQEVEQAMKQLRQNFQIYMQSMRDEADGAQADEVYPSLKEKF
uniref:Uncharacterized protein n=1 Tax=Spongospora subterranea TaxID=70186 RepID=A0A0H5R3T1_9EUKA|eukprot:CRZ08512.1 hypothetical protein [Spongospora subterranea]